MDFFIAAIGLFLVIEGMPYFLFPEKMKAVMLQVLQTPPATLRVMGFLFMAVGLLLVFVGRR